MRLQPRTTFNRQENSRKHLKVKVERVKIVTFVPVARIISGRGGRVPRNAAGFTTAYIKVCRKKIYQHVDNTQASPAAFPPPLLTTVLRYIVHAKNTTCHHGGFKVVREGWRWTSSAQMAETCQPTKERQENGTPSSSTVGHRRCHSSSTRNSQL